MASDDCLLARSQVGDRIQNPRNMKALIIEAVNRVERLVVGGVDMGSVDVGVWMWGVWMWGNSYGGNSYRRVKL